MMPKRLCIRVYGHVQGVTFRVTARSEALALALTGFVRNDPDGSVYLEAEGDQKALNEFLAWCHHGPRHATVQNVVSTVQPAVGSTHFEIR